MTLFPRGRLFAAAGELLVLIFGGEDLLVLGLLLLLLLQQTVVFGLDQSELLLSTLLGLLKVMATFLFWPVSSDLKWNSDDDDFRIKNS